MVDDLDIAQLEPARLGQRKSRGVSRRSPPPASGSMAAIREAPDNDLIPIVIDAGPAFGSGEHATTEGCLIAIDATGGELPRIRARSTWGCGSGILAIAIAKRWSRGMRAWRRQRPAHRFRFAREAVAHEWCRGPGGPSFEGDGYSAAEVAAHGPYDLIAANILLRPFGCHGRRSGPSFGARRHRCFIRPVGRSGGSGRGRPMRGCGSGACRPPTICAAGTAPRP